jgi:ABC-type nitrate/sulfonate/bicarbonate transport system permease component
VYLAIIVIIIIIIIIMLVITLLHGIYNYVPETNHVSRVYSVETILYLQFVLHIMLFRP